MGATGCLSTPRSVVSAGVGVDWCTPVVGGVVFGSTRVEAGARRGMANISHWEKVCLLLQK